MFCRWCTILKWLVTFGNSVGKLVASHHIHWFGFKSLGNVKPWIHKPPGGLIEGAPFNKPWFAMGRIPILEMGLSWNSCTPKSSILIGFSIVNCKPFFSWVIPWRAGNPQMFHPSLEAILKALEATLKKSVLPSWPSKRPGLVRGVGMLTFKAPEHSCWWGDHRRDSVLGGSSHGSFCGLVHPSSKWTTCPHKNPMKRTRVN